MEADGFGSALALSLVLDLSSDDKYKEKKLKISLDYLCLGLNQFELSSVHSKQISVETKALAKDYIRKVVVWVLNDVENKETSEYNWDKSK